MIGQSLEYTPIVWHTNMMIRSSRYQMTNQEVSAAIWLSALLR